MQDALQFIDRSQYQTPESLILVAQRAPGLFCLLQRSLKEILTLSETFRAVDDGNIRTAYPTGRRANLRLYVGEF
jgi:hypothetical protein